MEMKTFTQFLAESTLRPDQFPHIASHQSALLMKLLAQINALLEAGFLLKSQHEILRSLFSTLIEKACEVLVKQYIFTPTYYASPTRTMDDPTYRTFYDDILGNTPANQVAGKIKKVEKLSDSPLKRAYLPLANEFQILADALIDLKGKIGVRPTKAETIAKLAYHAPQSTKDAKALVADVTKKMSDQIIVEYAKDIGDEWIAALDNFFLKGDEERRIHLGLDQESIKAREERNKAARKQHGAWAKEEKRQPRFVETLLSLVSARDRDPQSGIIFTPHNDWKSIMRHHADTQAKDMQSQFMYKNVAKLASIVETKNNIDGEPKVLSIHTDRGSVTGELKFSFQDGSSFIVRNKVVRQSRYDGTNATSFYQFPTTFHDAILPGGKRMAGMPSEEQMNKIFAAAKG